MIEVIAGTNRLGSNTRRVADVVVRHFQSLEEPVGLLDLTELPADLFTPAAYVATPTSFGPWIDRILASSGLVVVMPEYNGGPPGVLKYFIDMLPFPESFEHRAVCFVGISSGEWGGLRPVEHMQQVFGYRNAHICPSRVFIRSVHQCFDGDGKLINDDINARLLKQAEFFRQFVRRIKANPE